MKVRAIRFLAWFAVLTVAGIAAGWVLARIAPPPAPPFRTVPRPGEML